MLPKHGKNKRCGCAGLWKKKRSRKRPGHGNGRNGGMPFLEIGKKIKLFRRISVTKKRHSPVPSGAVKEPPDEACITDGSGVPDGSGITDGSGVPDGSGITDGSGVPDGSGITDGSGAMDRSDICRGSRRMLNLRRASLTVEAAIALPFFFMAVVMLITFMDAVGIQTSKNLELSNKARKIAMMSSAAGSAARGTAADGIYIDLAENYSFKYPFTVLPVPDLKIALRARVYPWVGYKTGSDDADDSNDSDEMVYITDNESVYHTHADCTHLDLTIIETTTDAVGSLRNKYGQKYKKCDYFPKDYTGTVYVTEKGDCYYPSLNYGGVTRHVHLAKKSEVSDLKKCDRCAARDGTDGEDDGT